MKYLLLALLPLFASAPVLAADADPAIQAQLEALGYDYEVDEDGDYKLVFNMGENGRSQLVYVRSAVEEYGSHKVREIWSPAYRAAGTDFDATVANHLLQASDSLKLGGWVKQGPHAVFVIKLPADASNALLDDALSAAINTADEMEQELETEKGADQF